MGVSEINVWTLIRRYDKLEMEGQVPESTLRCASIFPGLTLDELRLLSRRWAGVGNDRESDKVLKIRRHDNNLIPLSALLGGSQRDKPFLIDVVNVHQYCPVEERTVPAEYVDAFGSKINNLEKRVSTAEACLPETSSSHLRTVENTAIQLANRVSFLDRRLTELLPPHWKEQIGQDSVIRQNML